MTRPSSPRGLPLGAQYIFTSLACGRFAAAMRTHPAAAGATVVDIHTRDPRKLEGAATETYIHTALRLPSGAFLDAEGVRSFAEMCDAFGMDEALSRVAEDAKASADEPDTPLNRRIRRLADVCGWGAGAPRAKDIDTVTDNWEEACADFDRHGGMAGKQEATIERFIRTAAQRPASPEALADLRAAVAGALAEAGVDRFVTVAFELRQTANGQRLELTRIEATPSGDGHGSAAMAAIAAAADRLGLVLVARVPDPGRQAALAQYELIAWLEGFGFEEVGAVRGTAVLRRKPVFDLGLDERPPDPAAAVAAGPR